MPAGENKSTGVLYSDFLAEKFKLEAPYEQYGLYLSSGVGLYLLGKNLFKANQLVEIQACTDAVKKQEMQKLGKFRDFEVKQAASYVAKFRRRGIAAGVSLPFLWLALRFAMHDGFSGPPHSKDKTVG